MKTLTNTVEKLAELNATNQNYIAFYNAPVNMQKVEKDFSLLLEYSNNYQKRHTENEPSLGDCLHLPDGQKVYFCHIWDDSVQTCGGGSYSLTKSGYLSFSGGLDSGIRIDEMELTEETDALNIWFAHAGWLQANCSIIANIEVRVWKPKQNADLSGIPQIEKLRKQKLKEQSEKVAKVNGNGIEYFEHLPSIFINEDAVSDQLIKKIESETGLIFEKTMYFNPCYWVQPMKQKQIDKLKKFKELQIVEERTLSSYELMLIVRKNKS
ncbi:hypothetical protein KO02_12390 [Sphingobacterium sp. ML3W]|uniref:hypothetical protein n=1 Tax=Sphingobacterium sp. ML3W TaxID=1538644 RepID=UPI0004F88C11|nr:hypothetical protein [Sphingobacterium sp. ML3W]AIM37400.1 hypothetical protein KO02_12390 [Sphingobacterium sp. ML3W]